MTAEEFVHTPWQMTRPCKKCGYQDLGYLTTKNGQDTVTCGGCGEYAGYNAPRSETGRDPRNHSTRPGIKPSKRARILARDNYTCILCHRADVPLDIGHLISVDAGRRQGLTDLELYADENLAAMCAPCNSGLSAQVVSVRFLVAALRARLTYLDNRREDQE